MGLYLIVQLLFLNIKGDRAFCESSDPLLTKDSVWPITLSLDKDYRDFFIYILLNVQNMVFYHPNTQV